MPPATAPAMTPVDVPLAAGCWAVEGGAKGGGRSCGGLDGLGGGLPNGLLGLGGSGVLVGGKLVGGGLLSGGLVGGGLLGGGLLGGRLLGVSGAALGCSEFQAGAAWVLRGGGHSCMIEPGLDTTPMTTVQVPNASAGAALPPPARTRLLGRFPHQTHQTPPAATPGQHFTEPQGLATACCTAALSCLTDALSSRICAAVAPTLASSAASTCAVQRAAAAVRRRQHRELLTVTVGGPSDEVAGRPPVRAGGRDAAAISSAGRPARRGAAHLRGALRLAPVLHELLGGGLRRAGRGGQAGGGGPGRGGAAGAGAEHQPRARRGARATAHLQGVRRRLLHQDVLQREGARLLGRRVQLGEDVLQLLDHRRAAAGVGCVMRLHLRPRACQPACAAAAEPLGSAGDWAAERRPGGPGAARDSWDRSVMGLLGVCLQRGARDSCAVYFCASVGAAGGLMGWAMYKD
jgi:hypothetical protein